MTLWPSGKASKINGILLGKWSIIFWSPFFSKEIESAVLEYLDILTVNLSFWHAHVFVFFFLGKNIDSHDTPYNCLNEKKRKRKTSMDKNIHVWIAGDVHVYSTPIQYGLLYKQQKKGINMTQLQFTKFKNFCKNILLIQIWDQKLHFVFPSHNVLICNLLFTRTEYTGKS